MKSPHSLASKSCLVPRAFIMVPLAQPPPAATRPLPLKATIDKDDATRLGSEADGSPRSKFHAFFWVSVSPLWVLEQPAGPSQALGAGRGCRAKEAKAGVRATFQQGQDPQPNLPLPGKSKMGVGGKARAGPGRRAGWAYQVFAKLLGDGVTSASPPPA